MAAATRLEHGKGPSQRLRRAGKQMRRRTVAFLARAMIWILARLPFSLTRRLLPWVARLCATPLVRRPIDHNLDLAFGDELDAAEKRDIRRRVCGNIGLFVAELIALVHGKLPEDYVDARSLDEIDRNVGRCGFVAVTAHMGNWELLASIMFRHWPERAGFIIARRQGNEHLNAIVAKTRARLGVQTIYQDDSPLEMLRLLRQGKILGTAPDQDVRRIAGIFVPFFGKPAYTPTGPAMLALHAGVPIAFGFARRTEHGVVIDCPEPLRPDPAAPRDAEIERLTQAWSELVEAQVRKQPSDWMWFHERWRTTPAGHAARKERKRREAEARHRREQDVAGRTG